MHRMRRLLCSAPILAALAFLFQGASSAHAQFYGGYGYSPYGGAGYGNGPGGYPYTLGGYGNYGYGAGFGAANAVYPPYMYGYPAYGFPPGYGLGMGYGWTGPGSSNPLFGLGLTPLGVQSALSERSLLGRGRAAYGGR
jgi:hypothetical protein